MAMTLHECLAQAPYAALLRIGKHYAVPIGHDCRRANVLARLLAAPLERAIRREVERACQGEARRPLQILAQAGDHCERAAFEQAFGSCRVPRSGPIAPRDVGTWLAARGMVFALADRVVLPAEFLGCIPPIQEPAPAIDQQRPVMPLYDLSLMLIAARRGALALDRRDGGLSRQAVISLRRLCSPTASDDSLRFLARVAMAARLLERWPTGQARPGPALDAWLARDPLEQVRVLWQGWSDDGMSPIQRPAVRRHHCRDCPWLRAALTHALAGGDTSGTDTWSPSDARAMPPPGTTHILNGSELALLWPALACAREGTCPATASPEASEPGYGPQLALEMLAGPFYWLGLSLARARPDGGIAVTLLPAGQQIIGGVPPSGGPPSPGAVKSRRHGDGRGLPGSAGVSPVPVAPPGRANSAASATPPQIIPDLPRANDNSQTLPPSPWTYADREAPGGSASAEADAETLRLAVPLDAPCAALLRLSDVASPVPGEPGLWLVEPPRLARLGREEGRGEAALAFLETMCGAPLPDRWRRALASTAGQRAMATVRPVLLLESLAPLPPATPALSAVLARTLSPRAAVVHARDVPALRRALARRGIDLDAEGVDIDAPATGDGARPDEGDATWAVRQRRVAAAVGLALLRALDARGLPVPPLPSADNVPLTEDEQTAAAVWTRRLLARLDTPADTGLPTEAPSPVPDAPDALDPSDLSATIGQAIAVSQPLRLRYHGAGATASWRLVEPHRLERRRGHTYLRAYCRDRQAERLFRLDRISVCDPVAGADTAPQTM